MNAIHRPSGDQMKLSTPVEIFVSGIGSPLPSAFITKICIVPVRIEMNATRVPSADHRAPPSRPVVVNARGSPSLETSTGTTQTFLAIRFAARSGVATV
ncbi:MAG: hypothetical protein LAO77_25960 [Acidobacteriia bacterium]|nr:hypothetical protein [Terriglobia bacterium]